MSSEIVEVVAALDAAREKLGEIRLGDLSERERERIVEEREHLNRLGDMLADDLTGAEHEVLLALEDEPVGEKALAELRERLVHEVAAGVNGDLAEADALTGSDLPNADAVDMNAHHSVGTVEWPEYDGREWVSQTFRVDFLAEALERAGDLQGDLANVCRLSLPRVDVPDWDEGSDRQVVLELEGSEEVVLVCPYADVSDRVGGRDE